MLLWMLLNLTRRSATALQLMEYVIGFGRVAQEKSLRFHLLYQKSKSVQLLSKVCFYELTYPNDMRPLLPKKGNQTSQKQNDSMAVSITAGHQKQSERALVACEGTIISFSKSSEYVALTDRNRSVPAEEAQGCIEPDYYLYTS